MAEAMKKKIRRIMVDVIKLPNLEIRYTLGEYKNGQNETFSEILRLKNERPELGSAHKVPKRKCHTQIQDSDVKKYQSKNFLSSKVKEQILKKE